MEKILDRPGVAGCSHGVLVNLQQSCHKKKLTPVLVLKRDCR
jgi:hypothetical protein